ncbi:MAG: heme exporter protein CcmD [Flavobacteriaceae bacterium]
MTHSGFIFAAYACGAVVVAGLVLWVTAEHARLRKRLEEAESMRSGKR